MLYIIFYFQVHQPFRVKRFNFVTLNQGSDYFNDELNAAVFNRVAEKCYLPTNKLFKELIERADGRFKIAYSLTGTFIEQAKKFRPEVLKSFIDLVKTGAVELLNETYYHSLSSIFDLDEFVEEVLEHAELVKKEFGFIPTTFRNTELIYFDKLSDILFATMPQIKTILIEGADRILKGDSPLYPRISANHAHLLLLKHYKLSDDIAFRFSDKSWKEYPLTPQKYLSWIKDLMLTEKEGKNLYLNLFMDYETFGEHQWPETGIFEFIKEFVLLALKEKNLKFLWPSEVKDTLNYTLCPLSVPNPTSWADTERDLSAWLSNSLQWNAMKTCYELIKKAKEEKRQDLLPILKKLSTSDHFYYMCIKYFQDGDVHKYFSPYSSPEEIYRYYMSILADIENKLEE
ncbi:alpha-amylase [Thermodesulfobacterium sp. TA1]|uniref:glycoside hydrolase family 57 protein n=1 Tax=Thermodesulfobacterium sp. TA1 TaxID=2234087 RepID=UPI0012320536|nr:glycoside hydrolase family 57 protein [Thermodesulfobacterium sp. TA1]QER42892.1 alpha-amylase [Thermodesulfobacterium sp. TA1]